MGRREGSDVHLPFDNQVSRNHARLGCVAVPTGNSDSSGAPYVLTFWLEDGGSRNGTFIDKVEASIEGRVSVRPGSLFRIGRTWLRLDIPLSYD
jgi:pSer/pThr/pTyr-binding forkhead associated (FHA) protein